MTNCMEEVCRICLSNDVNELKHEIFSEIQNYAQKIKYVVEELQISQDDQMSQKICTICCEHLIIAFNFKTKCLESDKILRSEKRVNATTIIDEIIIPEQPKLDVIQEPLPKAKRKKKRSVNKKISTYKIPHDQDYKCFICNKNFDLISEKDLHVKDKHKDDLKVCSTCGVKKQTSISFEAHLRYHKFGYRFLCSTCGKSFKFRNLLENHLRIEHTDSFALICDLCGFVTKFKINLQRHLKSFHLKIRNFKCGHKDCNAQYSTQVGLNLHLYRNHFVKPPVECSECYQGFTFNSELKGHMKHCRGTKVVNEMPVDEIEAGYRCRICQQIYETRSKFNVHYHHKHKKPNICYVCNKQMASSTSLLKHIRVQHEKIKRFQCEICSKSFGFKHTLDAHLNSHAGLKPFACVLCNFKAGDRSSVSKHKKKCHG